MGGGETISAVAFKNSQTHQRAFHAYTLLCQRQWTALLASEIDQTLHNNRLEKLIRKKKIADQIELSTVGAKDATYAHDNDFRAKCYRKMCPKCAPFLWSEIMGGCWTSANTLKWPFRWCKYKMHIQFRPSTEDGRRCALENFPFYYFLLRCLFSGGFRNGNSARNTNFFETSLLVSIMGIGQSTIHLFPLFSSFFFKIFKCVEKEELAHSCQFMCEIWSQSVYSVCSSGVHCVCVCAQMVDHRQTWFLLIFVEACDSL